MNKEVVKVVDWLKMNRLSLNLKKTHFIIFRRTRGKLLLNKELRIDNKKISLTNQTKFLGVKLDQNLTFSNHIQFTKGKVARSVGILHKCKYLVNNQTLLSLYYAFSYPYFNYCISVWGNTYPTLLLPLIRLQKRVLRIVAGVPRLAESAPIYANFKILTIRNIYIFSIQSFLFRYQNGKLPDIFDHFYSLNSDIHEYNTRQTHSFHTPLSMSPQKRSSVRSSGVVFNNYFIKHISYNCSYATYKKKLKHHILTNDLIAIFK